MRRWSFFLLGGMGEVEKKEKREKGGRREDKGEGRIREKGGKREKGGSVSRVKELVPLVRLLFCFRRSSFPSEGHNFGSDRLVSKSQCLSWSEKKKKEQEGGK
jgi:hypothetical protein